MSAVNTRKAYQKFWGKLNNKGKSLLFQVGLFFVIFLVVYSLSVYLSIKRMDAYNSAGYLIGMVLSKNPSMSQKTLKYYTDESTESRFSVIDYNKNKTLLLSVQGLKTGLVLSLPVALFFAYIVLFLYKKLLFKYNTEKTLASTFLRGGEFMEAEKLAEIIKKSGKASDIHIGNVPVEKDKEGRHFLFSGDTGTGKSLQIMSVLDVIRKRKKKAVIWDISGEFIQHYYDPDKDKILAPFDERSEYWSPFAEAKNLQEFERLALSFVPIPKEGTKHWAEASVTVFSWFLYKIYITLGVATPDQIFKKLINKVQVESVDSSGKKSVSRVREYVDMLKGTLAELVVDSEDGAEHASSVLSTLTPKIRAIWYLRGLEKKPVFSIKKWATDDEETGWLFVRANNEQVLLVKPLITAWLDTVISTVLSLSKNPDREVWAAVDEMQSLEEMGSISDALDQGRKHGLRLLLGFTSLSKLETIYGEKLVKQITSMCGNKAFFRTSESGVAEWASKMLLEEEIIEERANYSYGKNDNTGGSDQKNRSCLVMPSQIMSMDDLKAYIRLPGNVPTSLVSIDIVDRDCKQPHAVDRTIPDPISYSGEHDQKTEEKSTPIVERKPIFGRK